MSLCETYQASLHVIAVVPEFGLPMVGQFFPPDYETKLHEQVVTQLDELIAAQVSGGIEVTPIVATGKIYQQILETAKRIGADLIVMGGYGHWRLRESLFGGVTSDVLRQTEIPVLMSH